MEKGEAVTVDAMFTGFTKKTVVNAANKNV